MKRREFVKLTAMAGAATLLPWQKAFGAFPVQTASIPKFIQPLRGLGGAGIPLATPVSSYAGTSAYPGVNYYEIAVRQFTDQLHPNLLPTTLWGYGNKADPVTSFRHLGGLIVANRGTATRIRVFNELPATHILPVDKTPPGVDATTMAMHNRVAVHLHGGFVPWTSDGGPHHWIGPGDTGATLPTNYGLSYHQWLPDPNGGALTNDLWYPNLQSARLMWYHDHAVGITRLNAYAGVATGYLLQDAAEQVLVGSGAVPANQIPLVFQDKVFDPAGQLWYPSVYDLQFWILNPAPITPLPTLPSPSLTAEFWGDTMLVNGAVLPFVEVEPKRYRLRMLNACNTRFLSLQLVYSNGKAWPDNTETNASGPGPIMQQIGTEGGFLDPAIAPQGIPIGTAKNPLVLAPAERADVIVDFSKVKPGQFIILYNDAPVPFPGGTPLGDFYPGNNKLAVPPLPGFAPATRTVLQFRVKPLVTADPPVPAAWALPPLDPAPLAPFVAAGGIPAIPPGTPVRDLTLNETFDTYGRLEQRIGAVTLVPQLSGALGYGMAYTDTPTETPSAGAVEVWRIFNLTADAHPIHFHLVNVQIISREPFNVNQFNGIPSWTANPRGPDPNEIGWKETVKMYPGECTTVLMKFDLPPNPTIPVTIGTVTTNVAADPGISPRTGGHEYVYHCHILEHEEHDMMRPLVVA